MKTLFFCILTFLFSVPLISHEQETHEYIVKEAWKLLKMAYPEYNNLEINNWIGTDQHDGPWSTSNQGRVVAGSWREDDEDVIWDYACPVIPPFIYQYTNTHFWKVDDGPNHMNNIFANCLTGLDCGDYPNAFQKITKYQQGGWKLKNNFSMGQIHEVRYQRWDGQGYVYVTSFGPVGFKYEGLVEGSRNLYNTGYMEIVSYTNSAGIEIEVNPPVAIRSIINKYYAYEILGRMCHLLGDMGVPAHIHVDTHPAPWPCYEGDSYETKMKSLKEEYTANNTNGSFINPFTHNYMPPIQYLMTIMAQVADMFPSNDFEGNNNWPLYYDMPDYQNLDIHRDIFTSYGDQGVSAENCRKIANYCMRYNLRTTAGLLYWFVTMSGQKAPVITHITYNLPDKSINLGETGVFTAYPNDPGCTYTWERVNCAENLICQDLIPGVEETRTGNQYRIKNNTYAGVSCNTYVASCGPGQTDMVPGGLNFFIKVIARNASGEVTKYFSDDSKIAPTVEHRYGGCPYVYVQNDSGKFISDNNILHKSEFTENVGFDISDKYMLNVKPGVFDNKISMNLFESTHDISSINSIKLLAVDHPIGTKIGVTENNDIVMYYDEDVESPKNADRNHIENITQYVQYNNTRDIDTVSGIPTDDIYNNFDEEIIGGRIQSSRNKFNRLGRNLNRGMGDSVALIMRVGLNENLDRPPTWTPVAKRPAGNVTLSSDAASISTQFARRESPSLIIIPFGANNTSIEKADINWERDFSMSFAAVVDVFYSGFEITELPLSAALNSANYDLLEDLQNVDGYYATLDTSGIIMLQFDNVENNSGMIRDYVLVTDGKYAAGTPGQRPASMPKGLTKNAPDNLLGFTNKLNANFPNPFNPTTKINYQIKKDGFVSLKIYNVVGQLVKELVGEFKNAGNYIVEFNGSHLASGTYYYRIEANDFVETKKMILIK
ncbi:MAG: T9SS type A sorting domain-containing protein [Ignavibacteria bacterium]|jgi:hypothetical protein|nr:T9SS type A sorting domain-containing protein [Ignavibacteria bacterium]